MIQLRICRNLFTTLPYLMGIGKIWSVSGKLTSFGAQCTNLKPNRYTILLGQSKLSFFLYCERS